MFANPKKANIKFVDLLLDRLQPIQNVVHVQHSTPSQFPIPAQRLKVKRPGMNMFDVLCMCAIPRSDSYSLIVSLCSWKWRSFYTFETKRGNI